MNQNEKNLKEALEGMIALYEKDTRIYEPEPEAKKAYNVLASLKDSQTYNVWMWRYDNGEYNEAYTLDDSCSEAFAELQTFEMSKKLSCGRFVKVELSISGD